MIIPENILHETRVTVASLLGWDFPPNRRNDLERGIISTAVELGIKETPEAIAGWLTGTAWNELELDILSSYLTVGETYFFREKSGLQAFEKQIIPGIIKERQNKDQSLRIWCAGCCTGEEPYTLAIILRELIPDFDNWKITILATDINRKFLKKAQTGIYSQWSFRETSQVIKNKYFTSIGNNREIIPEITKMVTFAPLNLAEDQYPSVLTNTHQIDVIFCRNVLMYFTPEQIRLVARRFFNSLVENGWLITSAVELNDNYFSDFAGCRLEQGIFYQKHNRAAESVIVPDFNGLTCEINPASKRVPIYKSKPIRAAIPKKAEPLPSLNQIQVLFEKGRYQQCIEQCMLLLETKHTDAVVLTFVVKSYANMGSLNQARKWGEKLLSLPGTGADSYYLVANILFEENEPSMAESALKRALYIDPHHLLSHFLMGTVGHRTGKKSVAVKHFWNVRELLSAFPDNKVVPGSDGLTVGRIMEIVENYLIKM